jgi:dihydrofolate synthase / folylpolyglutamate synthase
MVSLPHWPKIPLQPQERKVDLTNIFRLLAAFDNPHEKLPPTIHVAGTNGKGSSVAMLKSIFNAANYKVHTYTSPHLLEFNERIKLADEKISDAHLFELLEKVRLKSEELGLDIAYFEGITVAAFIAFASVKADVLLLETGLGGRLDYTNVVAKPILTLITPVSFDHMEYLGNSIAEIATEKAGIIKRGAPCVISSQLQEAYDVLLNRCEELEAPAFCYEYDYGVEKREHGIRYVSQKYNLDLPFPSLLGDHQIINAAAVVASIMLVNDRFKISKEQIANGLINASWPGRLEKMQVKGVAADIYIDGAHNIAGAQILSSWIKENLKGPNYMIIGMTRNRDANAFCSCFKGVITEALSVSIESEPSSYSASTLQAKAASSGVNIRASESLEETS